MFESVIQGADNLLGVKSNLKPEMKRRSSLSERLMSNVIESTINNNGNSSNDTKPHANSMIHTRVLVLLQPSCYVYYYVNIQLNLFLKSSLII